MQILINTQQDMNYFRFTILCKTCISLVDFKCCYLGIFVAKITALKPWLNINAHYRNEFH